MYMTTAKNLLAIYKFFRDNPNGRVNTGMWDSDPWYRKDFDRWFLCCLHAKINRDDKRTGRKLSDDYSILLWHDVHIIRDYQNHVRSTGARNMLYLSGMKRRYPYINNQEDEK